MRRSWRYRLLPEFGPRIAEEITEIDWQRWIDSLARDGLVALDDREARLGRVGHLRLGVGAVAPAGPAEPAPARRAPAERREAASPRRPGARGRRAPRCAWSRRTVSPTRSRSTRACAAREIYRLEWDDVLEGDRIATRLLVRRSKSEAGTQRRPPIADNLRVVLADAWERQGRPSTGKVVDRSVMSGKIAARVEAAWTAAGLNRITLHECRHTYASLLMAAGYTIKELMEFMGHADLQMVNRYVKLLPQPGEDDAADRLNAYLRRSESSRTQIGQSESSLVLCERCRDAQLQRVRVDDAP